MELQVLHEDNHIIVVNKRVKDIVQGERQETNRYLRSLKNILKKTQQTQKFFWCGAPFRQTHNWNCSFFCQDQ
jgi:23S rRNA-/tRNA-specific pseudouridylate synthase